MWMLFADDCRRHAFRVSVSLHVFRGTAPSRRAREKATAASEMLETSPSNRNDGPFRRGVDWATSCGSQCELDIRLNLKLE